MNTEQIEAAIDKVLQKRGNGNVYFTANRAVVKRELLAEISEAQRQSLIADYQRAADAMRWSAYSSVDFPAETNRVQPMSVMVGSEHSGPDLSFLGVESKPAEKTYEITLERAFSAWRAVIKDRDGIVVDRILGRYMDSRADIFFAAKTLVKDLQKPQTVSVNAEGTVIQ